MKTAKKIILITLSIISILLAVFLLTVYLLTVFMFQAVVISGDSMNNTLYDKEVIYVNTVAEPELYDIAVISGKKGQAELIIKRIVATGGDTVLLTNDGELLIKRLGEDEFFPVYEDCALVPDGYRYESSWLINYPDGFIVPEGEYFYLGDNRANSNDSMHDYRTCKRDEIVGVAGDFLLSLKEETTKWFKFKDKVRVFFGADPYIA